MSGPEPAGAMAEPPVTVIQRRSGWHLFDPLELWQFRELLALLTWRDIQVRYKQTILGVAWAILQPLATMLVFSVFLGPIASKPAGDFPYPLFVLAGLVPWTFFANAISTAGQSVVTNRQLVTKVYFPRILIPIGSVGAGLVDLAIAFGILLFMMIAYGKVPGPSMLLTPLIVLGLLATALGAGILLSALTVSYRDFKYIIPFLVQFWMFATPAIYLQADEDVGSQWGEILPLNPAYGLIVNFRQATLGGPLDLYSLSISSAVGLGMLFVGCLFFRRVEQAFADVI